MEYPVYTNPKSTDPRSLNVFQMAHIEIVLSDEGATIIYYIGPTAFLTFERYKSFVIKIAIGYIYILLQRAFRK